MNRQSDGLNEDVEMHCGTSARCERRESYTLTFRRMETCIEVTSVSNLHRGRCMLGPKDSRAKRDQLWNLEQLPDFFLNPCTLPKIFLVDLLVLLTSSAARSFLSIALQNFPQAGIVPTITDFEANHTLSIFR